MPEPFRLQTYEAFGAKPSKSAVTKAPSSDGALSLGTLSAAGPSEVVVTVHL